MSAPPGAPPGRTCISRSTTRASGSIPTTCRPWPGAEASGTFDVKDSASAKVTRNPDGPETLASKSYRLLDRAGATLAAATETISASLGVAGETLSEATDEFSHSDTGKQLSAWSRQAQIAFEDRVLSQVDLEKLFDGFGEEDPDVIHE